MTPDKSLVKNILVYAVLLTHVNSDILFFFSMLQSGISRNIEKYITILPPAVFISDSVKQYAHQNIYITGKIELVR